MGDAGRVSESECRKALSRGIEIVRDYNDEQGKPVTQVTLGQKINVHLKVRQPRKRGQSNLAIVDLLPGGSEVVQQTPPEPPMPARRAKTAAVGSRRWPPPCSTLGAGLQRYP